MATDFTQMPPQILVELINITNGISLTLSDIDYGPVTAILSGNRNTAITVTAKPGSPYTGTRDLTYNRVNLADVPGVRSVVFDRGSANFVSQLIPQINMAYALNLQPEDYYNDRLPSADPGPYTSDKKFFLRARPESYVWRNQVELTLRGNKQYLPSIFSVDKLSGFSLPVEDLKDALVTSILTDFNFTPDTSDFNTVLVRDLFTVSKVEMSKE